MERRRRVALSSSWWFYLGFGALLLGFCYIWRTLLHVDILCWFGDVGGLYYDALAIGLLYLEELDVGELCLGLAIFGGFGGGCFGLCIGGFGGDVGG